MIFPFSTAVDRLLLYFYPLQIVVFYRMIKLIASPELKYIYFLMILCMYTTILIIWMKLAIHRDAWIPYNNLLFILLD